MDPDGQKTCAQGVLNAKIPPKPQLSYGNLSWAKFWIIRDYKCVRGSGQCDLSPQNWIVFG